MSNKSSDTTFLDGYKANFETLSQAFDDGNVVLMECKDAKTGELVACMLIRLAPIGRSRSGATTCPHTARRTSGRFGGRAQPEERSKGIHRVESPPGARSSGSKGTPARHAACASGAAAAPQAAARGRNWDATAFAGYGAPRGAYRKACVSDGNCSSMGSGRSCGGHDCDGY